jgi:hypothetical protein
VFCFADSDDFPVLSREHLVSRPLGNAFGIDRTSPFLRTDLTFQDMRWTTVNGVSRDVVCRRCNSEWMNVLEHQMSEVAQWMNGVGHALGAQRLRILRAWILKTHVLLCFIEGNAGRFGDEEFDGAVVVPPVSLARALFERRHEDLEEFGLGLARNDADTAFAYEFGTPGKVMVQGQERGAYTAPTSIITIGRLQAWAVTSIGALSPSISVPAWVLSSDPAVTPEDLQASPLLGNLKKVRVDYADSM